MTGSGHQYLDFLTRQPVEGTLLADRMAGGTLSAEEALGYAIEIGGVLNKAHARGLVHGSLSPYSICLAESGLHVLSPAGPGAQAAAYRAPEQVRGEAPDSRSDVFAFGAILYEMAAGTRAFPADVQDLNRSILDDPAPTLTLRSPVYDAMASVIAGCLQKNPAARRQRVQNAVIELRFAAKGASIPPASPAATWTKAPAPIPPPLAAPNPKPRPAEPPRAEQFFFKPGEPVFRVRNSREEQPGLLAMFQREGKLSLTGFRTRMAILIGASLVVLAGAAVGAAMYFRPRGSMPVLKFRVAPPEHTAYPGSPSVSPDGRHLVFSLQGSEGQRMLWIKPLDAEHMAPIAGTEGATNPFWSPDSQYLAFFAGRSLKSVRIKDGVTETVSKVEGPSGGGTWNRDGTILFAISDDGLYKIPAKGINAPTPVFKLNTNKGENAYMWPQFLPDGKHFLFFLRTDANDTTGVYGGSLDPADYHMIMASETNAVYSPLPEAPAQKNGYLLFISNRKLMGVGFNAPKMGVAGEPMTLADDIGAVRSLALAPLSVSNNATLVYQSTGKPTRQLVWVDRTGVDIAAVRDPGEWGPPRISPDGRKAVAARLSDDGTHADLWLTDNEGVTTQLTSNAAESNVCPVWAPDGSKLASAVADRREGGGFNLFVRHLEVGARPDLLFHSSFAKYPRDWSKDGRYVLFDSVSEGTKNDVWAVSTADRHAGAILNSVNSEAYPALSPDGKWLAYQSDETGKLEVYVQQFEGISSGTRKRWKVSGNGGGEPRWRADGKELFYLTLAGRVMAATVKPSTDEFEFQSPVKLFQTHAIPKVWNLFDASPDGQHFLLNVPLEWSNSSHITVVTNWTEKLKE